MGNPQTRISVTRAVILSRWLVFGAERSIIHGDEFDSSIVDLQQCSIDWIKASFISLMYGERQELQKRHGGELGVCVGGL